MPDQVLYLLCRRYGWQLDDARSVPAYLLPLLLRPGVE